MVRGETRPEPGLHLRQHGSKAAIEPDHQAIISSRFDGGQHAIELLVGERQRLLHEDGLTRLEGPAHQVGMGAMPGHDKHRIKGVVSQHFLRISTDSAEAELLLGVHRGERSPGGDPCQPTSLRGAICGSNIDDA